MPDPDPLAWLRERVEAMTPAPFVAPGYESPDAEVLSISMLMPAHAKHVIHVVDGFSPDGVTHADYDYDCEGYAECGVDDGGRWVTSLGVATLHNLASSMLAVIEAAQEVVTRREELQRNKSVFRSYLTAQKVLGNALDAFLADIREEMER